MVREPQLSRLGEFLRRRRAEIDPEEAGQATARRTRRVPGLRREEVARLAAISTDYYTRLEQGRVQASEPVLAELAKVLRLNDDQRIYLFELAGKGAAPRQAAEGPQQLQPQLRRILDDLNTTPAFIVGRRTDILAWNHTAASLFCDFGKIPEPERNFIWQMFTDTPIRRSHARWEESGQISVAQLRMEAARYPDDQPLAALVRELSKRNPHFRQWWTEHEVQTRTGGHTTLYHPDFGELEVDWTTLLCADDPDLQLIMWTTEPGTPAHDAFRQLSTG
ncbi:helix-turn-helix transcriptional regulator [Streptomyces arenae]|nr:helix-turn-helix transcriptional regulator [Streptomyces arenae]MCG7210113.1 helix-turn-helix transcriptional regulator [Streptomyces arenae]